MDWEDIEIHTGIAVGATIIAGIVSSLVGFWLLWLVVAGSFFWVVREAWQAKKKYGTWFTVGDWTKQKVMEAFLPVLGAMGTGIVMRALM